MREFEQMEMQYFVRPDRGGRRLRGVAAAPACVVRALRRDPVAAALPRARAPTSWRTTPRRRSTSSTASRSAGRSSRASTTAATSTCGATPRRRARTSSTSTGDRGALHPVDRRDGRRARDRAAVHVPHRRLPRGGGPGRDARLARAAPGSRAVQGRGAAAAQEAARDRRAVPQDQGRPASAT